jgi:spore maturation protein CgeB
MREYGYAPSTRLFEAAACGACIMSDTWPGLEQLFEADREILLADDKQAVLRHLESLTPERAREIGTAARVRVLRDHTYDRRAAEFEAAIQPLLTREKSTGKAWANAS